MRGTKDEVAVFLHLRECVETNALAQNVLVHDWPNVKFLAATSAGFDTTEHLIDRNVLSNVCWEPHSERPSVSATHQTWPAIPDKQVSVAQQTTHLQILHLASGSNPNILTCLQRVKVCVCLVGCRQVKSFLTMEQNTGNKSYILKHEWYFGLICRSSPSRFRNVMFLKA